MIGGVWCYKKSHTTSYGFPGLIKTQHKLMHIEMYFVVEELRRNISQQGNRHIAGKTYCCENGYGVPQNESSINDIYFIFLGFTALTYKHFLYIAIVSCIMETYEVKVSINIEAPVMGDSTDKDYFEKNNINAKLYPTGPVCEFNEK